MASPPAITQPGISTPAGLTNAYDCRYASGGVFRHFCGTSTGTVNFGWPSVTMVSGGNIGATLLGTVWRTEFIADALKVALQIIPSTVPWRFLVDDQYISFAGTVVTGSGNTFVVLDFTGVGDRAYRKITIEGQGGVTMYGVNVGTTEALYQTEGGNILKAVFMGDSYTGGASANIGGNNINGDSFALIMADYLGIRNMYVSGSGATGWFANNSGQGLKLRDRMIPDLINVAPDIAFVQGGMNDLITWTPDQVQGEVTAFLTQYQAALGSTPLFVFGVNPGTGGPSSLSINMEEGIQDAVEAFNFPTIQFIPVSTDPNGAWISGTGNTGAPSGTGNADLYITGTTHPNDAGHQFMGKRAADVIMQAYSLLP